LFGGRMQSPLPAEEVVDLDNLDGESARP
jgi:hypothetical protein